MKSKFSAVFWTKSAIIASLYVVLTFAQELVLPSTATMAVQFRLSEMLMVLSLFTPSAIVGLTVGCFFANFLCLSALPLDIILGSMATLLASVCMYAGRNSLIKNLPIIQLMLPAVFNGIIIGLEIEIFFISGDFNFTSFLVQAGLVALGEFVVCFGLGLLFYSKINKSSIKNLII